MACSISSCTVTFQDHNTLPKLNILSKLLLWLVCMEFSFRTSTPCQREIFSQSCYCDLFSLLIYSGLSGPVHPPKLKYSLKVVIVVCSYGVSFQDQHTLPKRNILSKLLLWLVLSARIWWPFRTSTLSQRKIFCLKAIIVACSLCSYTVAFQDQQTLPKRNILSKLLLWLVLSAHI